MEVKPGYKQTEVGVIPEEWDSKPLGELIKLQAGYSFLSQNFSDIGTPVIRISDIQDGVVNVDNAICHPAFRIDDAFVIKNGDFLIAMSGATTGKVGVFHSTKPAYQNQRVGRFVVRDRSRTSLAFVGQTVRSIQFRLQLSALLEQGAQPNVSGKQIESLVFPVPQAISEQRAIAEALSDVDGLLGGLDRLIAKKRDLKQAAMQQLLTGQTRLPGFHGAWEVQTVAELEKRRLVRLSRGKVISKKDIERAPGECPIYSSSVHNDGLFGRYGEFMFDEELITWSVDGGGNFFHRPKHKFSVTNVCGFMRVDTSHISYRFFAAHLQLLHSRKSFDYQSKAHPSVVRKEYEVQLPPILEQTAIAEVLTSMDAELTALEQRREKTRALKQAMMQELLTGRTRLV